MYGAWQPQDILLKHTMFQRLIFQSFRFFIWTLKIFLIFLHLKHFQLIVTIIANIYKYETFSLVALQFFDLIHSLIIKYNFPKVLTNQLSNYWYKKSPQVVDLTILCFFSKFLDYTPKMSYLVACICGMVNRTYIQKLRIVSHSTGSLTHWHLNRP